MGSFENAEYSSGAGSDYPELHKNGATGKMDVVNNSDSLSKYNNLPPDGADWTAVYYTAVNNHIHNLDGDKEPGYVFKHGVTKNQALLDENIIIETSKRSW